MKSESEAKGLLFFYIFGGMIEILILFSGEPIFDRGTILVPRRKGKLRVGIGEDLSLQDVNHERSRDQGDMPVFKERDLVAKVSSHLRSVRQPAENQKMKSGTGNGNVCWECPENFHLFGFER